MAIFRTVSASDHAPQGGRRASAPRGRLRGVVGRVARALLESHDPPRAPEDPSAPIRSVVDPRDIYLA